MHNLDSIHNLLPWTSPRRESTKQGSMIVRTAEVTAEFRRLYKTSRQSFEDNGVSLRHCPKVGQEIVEWRRDPMSENVSRKVFEKEVRDFQKKNLNFKVDMAGLLPYQGVAVKRNVYALRKYGFALEASDTGYGKTYVAFAVARHIGMRLLVVAPKPTLTVWKRVAKHMKMENELVAVWNVEKLKGGKLPYGHMEDYVEGNEILSKWVWTVDDDVMVVLDELHRFKGIRSANAQVFLACKENDVPTLGMSATVANDPTHMRGLGKILGFHDGSYYDFVRWARVNGCSEMGWDGALKFFGGFSVLSQLHRDIFPEHGNRQRVADLDDFPETLITADTYDMAGNTKHIKQAYRDMERELALIEAKEIAAKLKRNRLVIILRARQKIELLKVPAMVEMAKDALAEGMSVVLFVNFEATVQALGKALKTDTFIHGRQSNTIRNMMIDEFQADKRRVIICNIRAGGVGISLHDLNGQYARMSIIAPSWSAQDLVQALGRVHRAGGKTRSVQRIVFAAATIEVGVCDTVNGKLQELNTLQDGDMNSGVNLF